MLNAMVTGGIAAVVVSAICFALLRRAEIRNNGRASRRAAAASNSGNYGDDRNLVLFGSAGDGCGASSGSHCASSHSHGSCDAGGIDGGGGNSSH
jgi:hypothetical protein